MGQASESEATGFEAFETALGYRFRDRQYLTHALTHRSYVAESTPRVEPRDNERLEFLGDAILGFVASEALVARNPAAREGVLSRLKAHLVSADHLYACALQVGLGQYLLLGKGEDKNGGRERKALLANALEAVIAAIYLDGGMEAAKPFIRAKILQPLEGAEDLATIEVPNHKSLLQERAQALGLPAPSYLIVASEGPEHARVFVVEGRIGSHYSARGAGTSKKVASQGAAAALLEQLTANPVRI
ncbi:MAG TPA: ribonuclease III [Bryobacteraceae bacterium]|jgi:ribonuclease-3|nr:ribonuclease III [Bryobacteraceae bacterium]